MFDLVDLRVFLAVVEHGSFSKAAEALGYTQPAVSQRVARLERALGRTSLIDRTQRGQIRVTPPGNIVLRYANTIKADIEDLKREINALSGLAAGTIHVIAFPTAAATIVPKAVAAFRQANPLVGVRLSEAEPQAAFPQLIDGDADIVIGYTYPSVGAPGDTRIQGEEMLRDPMAVALPADHPLAGRPALGLEFLRHESWITPHECPCRRAIFKACGSAGFTPIVGSETNDYMAMQGLVASGVGIALMPQLVAAVSVHPQIVLRPLIGSALTRVVTLMVRPSGYQPPACAPMLAAIREAMANVSGYLTEVISPPPGTAITPEYTK